MSVFGGGRVDCHCILHYMLASGEGPGWDKLHVLRSNV